jgi:peptide/nickel transport system substrate-binding protein
MRDVSRLWPSILALAVLLTACTPTGAPPSGVSDPQRSGGSRTAEQPRRITAAIAGNPSILFWTLAHNWGQSAPGLSAIDDLLNGRLAAFDDRGALRPQLAEAVPSAENGLWTVFPDGRMETTWRLREGIRWHDGTPFTTRDILFTAQVIQDKELAVFADSRYEPIEAFEALDDRTFVVKWKRPHLEAVEIFTVGPMPRHLLEPAYLANKSAFTEQRFWAEDFVGTGPFALGQFLRGSLLVLRANDGYILGRPKLDEILVRFIPDGNTLVANILAGTVELTLGQALSLDQATALQAQQNETAVLTAVKNMWLADPQHLDPSPAVIGNVLFRRALLHGLDRQMLADTIGYGAPVGHSLVFAGAADYAAVEPAIVRYDYDPRRAAQLIEQLGYTRGADAIYQDSVGERLTLEVRTAPGDTNEKVLLAIANQWQQLGIATTPLLMSAAQNNDPQFRATFPGVSVRSHATGLRYLRYFFHTSVARTPERNYLGSNALRYRNAELDGLIDRYFATIAERPRMEIAAQAVRHLTENVVTMNLFHGTTPTVVGSRLRNVGPGGERVDQTWNAVTWDVE